MLSLGRSRRGRRFGDWIVAFTLAAVLSMSLLGIHKLSMNAQTVLSLFFIGNGTYNVWAFTHGYTVKFFRMGKEEAVVAKTDSRVLTVGLHLIMLPVSLAMFIW